MRSRVNDIIGFFSPQPVPGWVGTGQLPTWLNGWLPLGCNLVPTSSDGNTYVCNTGVDLTNLIGAGMKIRLTQVNLTTNAQTVLYFIVTAVSTTTLTLYGGTANVITASPITDVFYSPWQQPIGFNRDPLLWMEVTTSSARVSQASPVAGTWYNLGTLSLAIPIGAWMVSYHATLDVLGATSGIFTDCHSTLSTGNSTESDADWTAMEGIFQTGSQTSEFKTSVTRLKPITVAAKTSYFLNAKTAGGGVVTTIAFDGASPAGNTVIRAICAYL